MKLVMSTMLLMGVRPIVSNLFFNQSGDSVTVIPLMVRAEYRGQASVDCTSTGMVRSLLSTVKWSTDGHFTGRFFDALISRATPMCDVASARFGVNPISIL